MTVKIDRWYGRLGNNLIQIANACAMAEKYRTDVKYPNHYIIKDVPIFFGNSEVDLEGEFFSLKSHKFPRINNTDNEYVVSNRYRILKELGREILPYENKQMDYDLLIHFRGGDVFYGSATKSNIGYVQSPFSYYQFIMNEEAPKRVLMVCEDGMNPMIQKFINMYGGDESVSIDLSIGDSINNDINKIMNCKVLVCSGTGSFVPSLSSCSNKVEKLYYPLYNSTKGESILDIISEATKDMKNISDDTRFVFHHNYIKMGEWAGQIEDHNISDLELYGELL